VLALATTASAAPDLPDLVADAPGPKEPEIYDDRGTQRLLLRLDGYVHNRGTGALEMRGTGPADVAGQRVMGAVVQRVYDAAAPGGFGDRAGRARMWFESADFHNHWHVMNAMRYSLWSSDRAVEVAPAQKVGFCLVDSERRETHGPAGRVYGTAPTHNFCGQREPSRAEVVMGVSAGWRDVYQSGLTFQWVDISDTAPGRYWLRADADPDGVIEESAEVNAAAYAPTESVVNGYLARPVDAGTVPAGRAAPIDLEARTFDDALPATPGPLQFKIVTPPSSGTLDKAAGEWFSGSRVTYTPGPGHSGPVTFTFAARDATSAFPRSPRSASVTLTVAAPGPAPAPAPGPAAPTPRPAPAAAPAPLGISGAPATARTAGVTRLTATGPGAAEGVTWSVDGIAGGSARVGTISPDGVYRAPRTPPPGGAVTIAARSRSGAVATVVVRIVPAPARRPAPSLVPPAGGGLLSRVVLARQRRTLIAVVRPGHYGRLRFVARRGTERIGRCSMMGRAGVVATCSMKLTRRIAPDPFVCKLPRTKGLKLPGVRVTVTLGYGGKRRAIRRARTR
jgi:hypothetical protein